MKKICVIGLGYIGLPTAAILANHGYKVVGVDINSRIVNALNEGEIIIEEPGLPEFVRSAVLKGHLQASLTPECADAFIIAVPTPITEDYKADLAYVSAAVESVLPYLTAGNIVIVESTISPGTMEELVCPLLNKTGLAIGEELFVAHCPERVLPGKILKELVSNNRIVGGINGGSAEAAAAIYRSFVQGEIYLTDAKTAEMAKLMENTFRDVNIALANELAVIAEHIGLNALEVIRLANKHPRVNIHQPGPGVGGHCLAVDPYFIVEKAQRQARMIALARDINASMPAFVVSQIKKLCSQSPRKVAVLGITYKGNVDDFRESPAIEVIHLLQQEGIGVSVYDPHVDPIRFPTVADIAEALRDADCAVVLADHDEFKAINFGKYAELMRNPLLYDTKNCTGQFRGMVVHTLGEYGEQVVQIPQLAQEAI